MAEKRYYVVYYRGRYMNSFTSYSAARRAVEDYIRTWGGSYDDYDIDEEWK